jgi:hypothetical protein
MPQYKAGDLVKTKSRFRNKWVVLNVTKEDVANGLNCSGPGLYMFSGYWYYSVTHVDSRGVLDTSSVGAHALSPRSYGKIQSLEGQVIGRVRGHRVAYKHLR